MTLLQGLLLWLGLIFVTSIAFAFILSFLIPETIWCHHRTNFILLSVCLGLSWPVAVPLIIFILYIVFCLFCIDLLTKGIKNAGTSKRNRTKE